MRRYLVIMLIVAATVFIGVAQSKPAPVPEPVPEEQLKQLEQDIYLLGEKYYELEVQLKDLDERLKDLEKSHELAIFVNQDLDERLSKVENRRR